MQNTENVPVELDGKPDDPKVAEGLRSVAVELRRVQAISIELRKLQAITTELRRLHDLIERFLPAKERAGYKTPFEKVSEELAPK